MECLNEISLGADKIIFTKAEGNPRAAEPKITCKNNLKKSVEK